jgi:hypothetical protein
MHLNDVKESKTDSPTDNNQISDNHADSYQPSDPKLETTEDRLKEQKTPLSQLATTPTTAEKLTGDNPANSTQSTSQLQGVTEENQTPTKESETVEAVIATVEDIVAETSDAVETFADPDEKIAQLNSDGDQVVMKAYTQAEGQFVGGLKMRYGYDLTIQQVGDIQAQGGADDDNVNYQVSFNKRLMAGVGVELPIPVAEIKGEVRGSTDDTVTMTFESQEEASKAVRILQKTALTETANDVTSVADNTADGVVKPIPVSDIPVNYTDNPVSNPLRSPEEDHSSVVEHSGMAPTAEELEFISDHITSYSTTLSNEGRAKFGLEAPALLGYEIRLDKADTITRTVTLPSEGEPGRISYTIGNAIDSSSKEALDLGPKLFDAFQLTYTAENVVEHGELSSEVTFNWDIPASEWTKFDPSNFGSAESSLFTTGNMAPDSVESKLTLIHQDQVLTDPSRTDLKRYTITSSLDNPVRTTSQTVSKLLTGDLGGALTALSKESDMTITGEHIDRIGVRQEHGIDFQLKDVIEGKVKLIFEAGVDDITPLKGWTTDNQPEVTDDQLQVPETEETNNQWVVVPRNGVNLRTEPGVENSSAAILYHGTFIQATGTESKDGQGNTWLEVSGTDVNDQPAKGWVRGDLVAEHPEGAMDETGRINPDLEAAGYRQITVVDEDNLWDLAQAQGVDIDKTVELNQTHIIEPDLIFPGDTVYVPNTEGELSPESSETAEPPESTESTGSPESTATPEPTETAEAPEPTESSGSTLNESFSPSSHETEMEGDQPDKSDLDAILHDYQIVTDTDDMVNFYTPDVLPFSMENVAVDVWNQLTGDDIQLILHRKITASEAKLLDSLGIVELKELNDATDFARETAQDRVGKGLEDGHGDAYRHAMWSAGITRALGAEFSEAYTNAHEAVPGNPADKEAMDLYNNEVGHQIALDNPYASPEELADLTMEALEEGKLIVIDGDGELAWSNQVAWGETGFADDAPAKGVIAPAEEVNSN